jgi:hypothetical protein
MADNPRAPIQILNCPVCEDFFRLQESLPRSCLCGKSAGRFTGKGFVLSGPARIVEIEIEEYDGAIPGEDRSWRLKA